MTKLLDGTLGRAMEVSGWNLRRGTWDTDTAMKFVNQVNEDRKANHDLVCDFHEAMVVEQAEQDQMLQKVFGQDLHN